MPVTTEPSVDQLAFTKPNTLSPAEVDKQFWRIAKLAGDTAVGHMVENGPTTLDPTDQEALSKSAEDVTAGTEIDAEGDNQLIETVEEAYDLAIAEYNKRTAEKDRNLMTTVPPTPPQDEPHTTLETALDADEEEDADEDEEDQLEEAEEADDAHDDDAQLLGDEAGEDEKAEQHINAEDDVTLSEQEMIAEVNEALKDLGYAVNFVPIGSEINHHMGPISDSYTIHEPGSNTVTVVEIYHDDKEHPRPANVTTYTKQKNGNLTVNTRMGTSPSKEGETHEYTPTDAGPWQRPDGQIMALSPMIAQMLGGPARAERVKELV